MITTDKLRKMYSDGLLEVLTRSDKPPVSIDGLEVGEILTTAVKLMQSSCRNERVLALRIVSTIISDSAVDTIIRGLSDGERRVREVAVKAARHYLKYPEVSLRLQEMVLDDGEKRKIRAAAMNSLSGVGAGKPLSELPLVAAEILKDFVRSDSHRMAVLFALLRLELNSTVEGLLREFVKDGSKEEAVLATRALCGYRVINLGEIADPGMRKKVAASCESAAGEVFYWVKRGETFGARSGEPA